MTVLAGVITWGVLVGFLGSAVYTGVTGLRMFKAAEESMGLWGERDRLQSRVADLKHELGR